MLIKFPFFLFSFWFIFSASVIAQEDIPKNKDMNERVEKTSTTLEVFNLAVSAHQDKNYQLALTNYRRVIRSDSPLKVVAAYYSAKIYLVLGKQKKAKNYIKLINIDKLPVNLKSRVMDFKQSLSSTGELPPSSATEYDDNKFSGRIRLSYGLNSNPEYTSEDDTQAEVSSEGQLDYDVLTQWQILSSGHFDWGLSYNGSGRSYNDSTDSNYSSHTLGTPYHFYRSGYRLLIYPSFSFQTYSGDSFSRIFGGQIEIMKKIDKSYWGAGYTTEKIKMIDSNYSYLAGNNSSYYLKWIRSLFSSSSLHFSYTFGNNNYKDTASVSSSYDSHKVRAAFSYQKEALSWLLGFNHEWREYRFDFVESDQREDNKLFLDFYGAYALTSNWALYANGYYVINRSNFDQNNSDDKNYQQAYINLGLILSF